MKSTMAARFLSRNGLRTAQMIISVSPMASRCANSGRAILRSSGSSENGSTPGIRSTFFSASMARMVGNGVSITV